jgi:hypothetical protein
VIDKNIRNMAVDSDRSKRFGSYRLVGGWYPDGSVALREQLSTKGSRLIFG